MPDRFKHFGLPNALVILGSTLVFCAIAIWMVLPVPPPGFYWDDTWYLLMAEFLSGRTEHQQLAWGMLQLRQYPPFFSFILSMTGDVLNNQQNAFIMNAVFLALGAGVAMVWFIREGFTTATSVLAAIILMFNPMALYWLPILFSEHLFILLTALAFALVSFRSNNVVLWIGVGILVGLSVATRSAGWALVAGMLMFLILDRKLNPALAFIGGLITGLACIPLLKAGFPLSKTYQGSIIESLSNFNWDYFTQQLVAILVGWQQLWGSTSGAVLAAVIVIPGIVIRLSKNKSDAWYILAYLAMLILWPFPDHMSRFLWPLLPMFLISAYSAVVFYQLKKHSNTVISLVFVFIFVVSVPTGIGLSLDRLLNPPNAEFYDLSRMMEWTRSEDRESGLIALKTRRQFLVDMERINNLTGDKYCIYSEFSMMVSTHTQRVAIASPWEALREVDSLQLKCPYYYSVPSTLPNTTDADLVNFGKNHKELFRSMTPFGPNGEQVLGVFYVLQ